MYQIQTATWRDLKELQRLEEICFEQDSWPLLDLVAVLTFPSTVRLKAVMEDKMVGFIAGEIRAREQAGWVTTIGVLPDYRQQGIATALLHECEKALNMPRVKLCVRRSNLPAQKLYIGLGYEQVGTWKRYYTGQEDALVYEKRITFPKDLDK